ncbi:MAG TPA: succinylglutamate desuccinylase/aspartoacylase family protein [Burkholderiaceae bacterium]|nr:succinylglutamate desuccinylase/aspartoacylase family protein [Burkholderiaceae bacterium]
MQIRHHPLAGAPLGTQREIVSFHHGPQDTGRKVYVQASLHADELPGMLVAHHLRQRLLALEGAGRLRGEVVVVPVANPIGIGQTVLLANEGRFELGSGENFNRHYPALFEPVAARLEGRLGGDAGANAQLIRAALRASIAALPEDTELISQRKTLLGLACDAEVVLDLHCDAESLLHLYTGTALWPQAEPLARLTGARASLLADESGDNPFDEACAQTWWQLEAHFRGRHPIPMGCLSVTLELRGETDVSHRMASADADALVAFLTHRGIVDGLPPVLPPLREPATPLAGTDVLKAPVSGVVVYVRELGEVIRAGEVVFEIVEPISGVVHPVASRADGLFFARESQRYARAGRALAKVAGAVAVRSGKLSSD